MVGILKSYLQKEFQIADEEIEELGFFLTAATVSKNKIIISEGEPCLHSIFVVSGLLSCFVKNKNGNERIPAFVCENCWVMDYESFFGNGVWQFGVDAFEDSEIILATPEFFKKLLAMVPDPMHFIELFFIPEITRLRRQVNGHLAANVDERYNCFRENNPSLFQRLNGKDIALHVGVCPQSLSRMRSKGAVKKQGKKKGKKKG